MCAPVVDLLGNGEQSMRFEYELIAGHGGGDKVREQSDGRFPTLADAQEHAVPGHPDEWIYLDPWGYWFHGGGNEAGQYFRIVQVTAEEATP